jgi:hypothetical protein
VNLERTERRALRRALIAEARCVRRSESLPSALNALLIETRADGDAVQARLNLAARRTEVQGVFNTWLAE